MEPREIVQGVVLSLNLFKFENDEISLFFLNEVWVSYSSENAIALIKKTTNFRVKRVKDLVFVKINVDQFDLFVYPRFIKIIFLVYDRAIRIEINTARFANVVKLQI